MDTKIEGNGSSGWLRRRLGAEDLDWLSATLQQAFPRVELRAKEDLGRCLHVPNYEALVFAPEEEGLWPRSDASGQICPAAALLCRWRLAELDFWEYYCVSPALRGRGYGAQLLTGLLAERGRALIFEVEEPELSPQAQRRVAFYERHGCQLHRRPYYLQPGLQEGQGPLRLCLMSWGRNWTVEELRARAQHFGAEIYGRRDFCSCPRGDLD